MENLWGIIIPAALSLIGVILSIRASMVINKATARKYNTESDSIIAGNYEALIKKYVNDIERLEKKLSLQEERISLLELENKTLHVEVESMRTNFILMEASNRRLPIPYWIKDKESRMLFLNDEYEQEFKVTLVEYKGKTDAEFWGNEIGHEYMAHDKHVMETGRR